MAAMGVTRASLGVQDFDPKVQEAVGRLQSFEATSDCADRLRSIGVASINLDLIYGLPYQTEAGVRRDGRPGAGASDPTAPRCSAMPMCRG